MATSRTTMRDRAAHLAHLLGAKTKVRLLNRIGLALVVSGLTLGGSVARASEIGQQIADQIDVGSYQYFLDELLYAHDGDNRDIFGAEHDPCRDNIFATFQGFGLDVELHEFELYGPRYNVVATQLGRVYPDAQYVIGAHFDSAGNPGADDDASGVAGMLEAARVLAQYETEYTIKFIAFDAEEYGMIGSQAYVDDHYMDDIRGMIQMEMMAFDTGGWRAAMYGRSSSGPLKDALAAAIAEYGNDLTVYVFGEFDASDHAPFEWAGFQACAISEYDWIMNPCYHQQCDSVDTPDYINYEFATDFARSVAGFLADHAVVILPEPCVGDLDGDGKTDGTDLGILLADWGCTSNCVGDLDGDDDTDQGDLGILLADWGCGGNP
ncbi:MAG TPA: M20/M25/M40 family metallo-hydrolase [Phycisphaerae bacterium]|nr:M20/M25/M40 family metallo-hydrolase [Phycisphaerae bacterium]